MPGSTSDTATDSGGSETGEGSTGGGMGVVTLETTLGDIVIQLDPMAAPITSANFLAYVESGFYDGSDGLDPTIIHRVAPGFVIQGGGLTETLMEKATMPPIVNESGNGLSNTRGTVAMARTMDPDSATSQWFINLEDNLFLDDPPGYAVFGEVTEGMDIVDMIAAVPLEDVGPYEGVPVDPIFILSATAE
jgi:peptidyl-prolyl cis-trans isomerase A (cyclophilin A)